MITDYKMNNLKKIIAIATIVSSLLMTAGPAFGATAEELAASIAALQAQLTALTAQLAALQGVPAAGVPGACVGITFSRNLSQTMSGTDVKCLQAILNLTADTKVAATGAGSPGNETTYFGSLTKAAVVNYQEKYAAEILAPIGLTAGTGFVGAKTLAKLNSVLVVTPPVACTTNANCSTGQYCQAGTCVTAPVTGALTVSLAVDNPAGGLILAGSANNAVTKITFNAAADADTNITGLKIKSYGTANLQAADIAGIKVFDGTKQLGLTQIQVAGISYFIFAPALTIAKGTSKTLSIAVNIVPTGVFGSTPSATVKMGIEAATSITGATFTGTFPIVGNAFTIVAGGALGQVNVTPGAPIPFNVAAIGQKDVVLGNFIVTAGTNEDINITQFNVTYGGFANISNAQDADITNLRIKVDGVLTGNSASFATRRAAIDFATPVPIVKGTSKIFQVIGDISGAGRQIELSCEVGSIFGIGVTSGTGVSGPAVRFNLGATNAIGFGQGALAVSVSTASPSGAGANVVRSVTPQILGVYDIRAVGEDVLINTVNLDLSETSGNLGAGANESISNVGLYNEAGALLSNQVTFTETTLDLTAPNGQTFQMNWLVPANTTQKLYIKGTTSTLAPVAGAPYVINVQLDNAIFGQGGQSIWATGLASAGQAGPNNIFTASVLALPALTINASAGFVAIGDASATPRNQAIVASAPQLLTGTVRFTAQREDQSLRGLALVGTASAGAGTVVNYFSGVALFDGVNQITNFVVPGANTGAGQVCSVAVGGLIGAAANDVVCFAPTDIFIPTTFIVNTTKTLKIVANTLPVVAPLAEGDDVFWNIGNAAADGLGATIDGLQTLGRTSGQIAENVAAAIPLTVNSGNLGAGTGGDLAIFSDVLEVKKTVDSPSGTVARSNNARLAAWEFTSRGTGVNLQIASITFTSLTGGLGGVGVAVGDFKLYDETNGIGLAAAANVLNAVTGQVTFNAGGNVFIATPGVPVTISLLVDTTSLVKFIAGTQLNWAIRQGDTIGGGVSDVTVGTVGVGNDRGVGITGNVISIPATANIVTVP